MCAGNFIYKLYRARAFSRLICHDFAHKASEPRRAEWGGRKQRGKSLGRWYEWFISRGRLIFRPGRGGKRPVEETLVSLPFLHLVFLFFPVLHPPHPSTVWHNLTAFYRAHACLFDIIAIALLFTVRVHPADIFYGLNFIRRALHPRCTATTTIPDGFLTTAFSNDVVCRLHVIFFSPSLYVVRIPSLM